jgi:hypothetical protein
VSSLALSPTGNHIAVWEGPLEVGIVYTSTLKFRLILGSQYKLYILTLAGEILASFSPESDPGFGIRTVSWHPSGLFLVVGGYDDKV